MSMQDHGCGAPKGTGEQPVTVHDMGCSLDDLSVLRLARLYFQTFARPESHGWVSALLGARGRFEGRDSAQIAIAIMEVVRHMGAARKSPFVYSNPNCKTCSLRISDCEWKFMRVLQATRQGQRSSAYVNAMLLCEGNDSSAFLTAMQDLCQVLEHSVPQTEDKTTAQ